MSGMLAVLKPCPFYTDLRAARVFRRKLQDNHGALRSAAPSDEDLATLIRAQREEAAKEALTLLHPTTGITIDGQAWVEQIRADAIRPIVAERDAAREKLEQVERSRSSWEADAKRECENASYWCEMCEQARAKRDAVREKVRGLVELGIRAFQALSELHADGGCKECQNNSGSECPLLADLFKAYLRQLAGDSP